MSPRPSVYVSRRLGVPPTPSPNNGIAAVTTEIRIFAPAATPAIVLFSELSSAIDEAEAKLDLGPWPALDLAMAGYVLDAFGLAVPRARLPLDGGSPGRGPSS